MSDVRGQQGAADDELPSLILLPDQSLSYRLCAMLADAYQDVAHVRQFGLDEKDDWDVWEFAKVTGLVIVSKDSDFHHLSFLRGAPPKVLWLDIGNCAVERIEALLRTNVVRVIAFWRDPDASFLILAEPS